MVNTKGNLTNTISIVSDEHTKAQSNTMWAAQVKQQSGTIRPGIGLLGEYLLFGPQLANLK